MKNKLLESITEIEKNGVEFTNIYVGERLIWSLLGNVNHITATLTAVSEMNDLESLIVFAETNLLNSESLTKSAKQHKINQQAYKIRQNTISNVNLLIKAKLSEETVINYGEGFKKIAK